MKKIFLFIVLLAIISSCSKEANEQVNAINVPENIANENTINPDENMVNENVPEESHARERFMQNKCSGKAIKFSYLPVNLEKTLYIIPMGGTAGEHVAPIDHQYYQNFNIEDPIIEVYSPADGIVTGIQHMGSFRGDNDEPPFDDYRLVIQHTCTISTIFIHVTKLSERLMEVAPKFGEQVQVNVQVKAGEIIGWYAKNVDFNVVDTEFTINFINQKSYEWDRNRAHIQDPFLYYDEPLKSQLIAKSLRQEKPEGGTIDYDVDGKLIGTWFKEGTNGWQGLRMERYWADHLAIVPDNIDPEHIIFSIGTYEGKARQFGVKGNQPNPAEVSVDSGIIKYELVEYSMVDGDQGWDFRRFAKGLKIKNLDSVVKGTALLQMLDDRRLKVEIFPGKLGNGVTGFTENAQVYER